MYLYYTLHHIKLCMLRNKTKKVLTNKTCSKHNTKVLWYHLICSFVNISLNYKCWIFDVEAFSGLHLAPSNLCGFVMNTYNNHDYLWGNCFKEMLSDMDLEEVFVLVWCHNVKCYVDLGPWLAKEKVKETFADTDCKYVYASHWS